ncbi:MAG: hypothetical protein AAGD00_08395 [Planctomycetota bacterium]
MGSSKTTRSCRRFVTVAAVAGAGLASLGGCSKADQFRANPTPVLQSTTQTNGQQNNRLTITADSNFRMMTEDLSRVMLLDKPSSLSPRPNPY